MRSLAGLSVRSLVRSRRRYALTALGASLGVAVLFAVLVTSAVTSAALDRAVRGSTGRADVVISPAGSFDSVLPAGTRNRVAALPGVDDAVSSVGMRSAVAHVDGDDADPDDRIAFLVGAGEAQDRMSPRTRVQGRAPVPGAAEVDVPALLADRWDIELGDRLRLAAPSGPVVVTVTGLLADRGAATANQGAVLFTSVADVRAFLGAPGAANGVQVDLAPGTDPAAWIDRNRAALTDVSVQDAADLAAGFRSFLDGINAALTLVAAIALFVGGFLVHLTFTVAVAERTRVLGTLRALGAVRRRVRRLVLFEAVLLGGACAALGLAVGYVLALGAISTFGSLLDLETGAVGLPVAPATFSAATGVVVAGLASWLPARRAARLEPVTAMRQGAVAVEAPARRWLGPALLPVGAAVALHGTSVAMTALGLAALLAGAVLSVHLAVPPLARLVGAVSARIVRGTGRIATRHVVADGTRSSHTLALVMVSLAAVLAVGASHRAMSSSLDAMLDEMAGAVQVGAPGAADDALAAELAAVPGVATLSPVRFGETALAFDHGGGVHRSTSFLQVIDPDTFFDVSGLPFTEGDEGSARAALAAGGALILPAHEANRLGAGVGDVVAVTTPEGPEPFTVVGTYAALGGGFGTVASTSDLARLGGGRVNGYLAATDGTDIEAVADAIRAGPGRDRQLVVSSPADTRALAEAQVSGFFGLGYAILAVAVVISLLGLANTLVVAVLARTREIGVLRSSGARRRQVRAMVATEAVTLAAIATVLALPLAAVMGASIVRGQQATFGGAIGFSFPWPLVPPLVLGALVVAAVAAAIPARRAGRLQIVDALRSE